MGRGQKSHPRINASPADKNALIHICVLNNCWSGELIQDSLGIAKNGYFYATYPTNARVDDLEALKHFFNKIARTTRDQELKDALVWLGGFSPEAIEFLEQKNPGCAKVYGLAQQRAR